MTRTTTKTRKVRSDKGKPRAKKADARKAPRAARALLPTADAGEAKATATKSVIKAEYKQRYGKSGNCGDEVATRLAKAVGSPADPDKLRKFCEANDLPTYDHLNIGQRRMCVGVRLRALDRAGASIKWGR